MFYKKKPRLTIVTFMDSIEAVKEVSKNIFTQNWKDFEWIVIAVNIKDRRSFNARIYPYSDCLTKLIFANGNHTDTVLKNLALRYVKGEYVLFLDSGCKLVDNVLEKIFKDKEYNAPILYGDFYDINNEKKYFIKSPDNICKYYFVSSFLDRNAVFLHKSLFAIYGEFNKNYSFYNILEKLIIANNNNKRFKYLDVPVVSKKHIKLDIETKKIKREELTRLIYSKYSFNEINNYYNFNMTGFKKIFSLTREAGIKVMWCLGVKVIFR